MILVVGACFAIGAGADAVAAPASGSLYQQLEVNWRHDQWNGNDRADFQIPGIGVGDVMCSPSTTWIQFTPSNPVAESDMWTVKNELKNGVWQTAVKDARVYRFSTPTSTVPHGTASSAYEGFNQQTPIETADSGSLVGLITSRGARNAQGGPGVAATSVHLSWSWSGFHTSQAQCQVKASFVTQISGPSRKLSEGAASPSTQSVGPVQSFNINWHGTAEVPAAEQRPSSLTIPGVGTLSGTCQPGIDGLAYLTLTPASGATPYASVTTYQGEGIENAVKDEYYTDASTGTVPPIPLPVNGEIDMTVLPAWNAPATQATQVLVSSLRVTNDPDDANDFCEVSVQSVGAPVPTS